MIQKNRWGNLILQKNVDTTLPHDNSHVFVHLGLFFTIKIPHVYLSVRKTHGGQLYTIAAVWVKVVCSSFVVFIFARHPRQMKRALRWARLAVALLQGFPILFLRCPRTQGLGCGFRCDSSHVQPILLKGAVASVLSFNAWIEECVIVLMNMRDENTLVNDSSLRRWLDRLLAYALWSASE